MVDSCFTVSIFSVCSVIFAVLLRQYCREQSLLAALAACIGILLAVLTLVQPVIQQVRELFETAGISSSYLSVVFKAAAICFITQITTEICRDSGERAIASAAELWGRCAVTVISLPIISALIEMINDFL
ncbi:MAG: hypothetical protein E7497_00090 [Ruminococcus sp.]|nr:hypothetical protein [Ruminococcus sp.]